MFQGIDSQRHYNTMEELGKLFLRSAKVMRLIVLSGMQEELGCWTCLESEMTSIKGVQNILMDEVSWGGLVLRQPGVVISGELLWFIPLPSTSVWCPSKPHREVMLSSPWWRRLLLYRSKILVSSCWPRQLSCKPWDIPLIFDALPEPLDEDVVIQRPRPSMLILMLWVLRILINASAVNWCPGRVDICGVRSGDRLFRAQYRRGIQVFESLRKGPSGCPVHDGHNNKILSPWECR